MIPKSSLTISFSAFIVIGVVTLLPITSCGTGTAAPATGTATSVNHVIFMMQENRTFDTYFGLLNPYRKANSFNVGDDGNTYNVDGIDDKLTTANADDEGASFPLSIPPAVA